MQPLKLTSFCTLTNMCIMQIYCPQHPLVGHWLAVCRNKISPSPIFRQAIAELGRILIYEASQDWLPTLKGQIETPLGVAECRFIDPQKPVKVESQYLSNAFRQKNALKLDTNCLQTYWSQETDSWCCFQFSRTSLHDYLPSCPIQPQGSVEMQVELYWASGASYCCRLSLFLELVLSC